MTIDQLVVTFHRETDELLASLEEGLLELESTDDAAACVDRLFRVAHTLKGNAGMVGFAEFVKLTHVLENVLDRLRSRTLNVSPGLIETLFHGFDALKATAEAFANGEPFQSTAAYEQALSDLFALSDAEEISATEAAEREMEVEVYFRPEFWSSGDDLTTFLDELGMLGELLRVETLCDRVPPLADLAPEQCHLGLRVLLRTTSGQMGVMGVCFLSVDEENIKIREVGTRATAAAPKEDQVETETSGRVHEASPAATEAAEAPRAAAPAAARQQANAKNGANVRASTIRVDADKLDRLMDLVGELVIGISQVQDRSR